MGQIQTHLRSKPVLGQIWTVGHDHNTNDKPVCFRCIPHYVKQNNINIKHKHDIEKRDVFDLLKFIYQFRVDPVHGSSWFKLVLTGFKWMDSGLLISQTGRLRSKHLSLCQTCRAWLRQHDCKWTWPWSQVSPAQIQPLGSYNPPLQISKSKSKSKVWLNQDGSSQWSRGWKVTHHYKKKTVKISPIIMLGLCLLTCIKAVTNW